MRRLKLTGIDEGYSVIVSTQLSGADDPELFEDIASNALFISALTLAPVELSIT